MMCGFTITLYYIFSNEHLHNLDNTKLISSVEQLPRFFATVIFAIEGIGVVSSTLIYVPLAFFASPNVPRIRIVIAGDARGEQHETSAALLGMS